MPIELPLYGQEKPKSCALACLRMVLAAFGREVSEAEIRTVARMERRGTAIDELERVARVYGLDAQIEETTPEDLRRILSEGGLPIVYIDRGIFDLRLSER